MRFSSDPAAPAVRVRWYFVGDDAPAFPFPNSFMSYDYWSAEKEYWPDSVGEQYLGQTLNVSRPGPIAAPDQVPCGSRDQWMNGVAWPWPNLTYTPLGPACCFGRHWLGRARLVVRGVSDFAGAGAWTGSAGLLLGGSSVFTPGWTGAAGLLLGGVQRRPVPYHWNGVARLKGGGTSTFFGLHTFAGKAPLKADGSSTFHGFTALRGKAPLKAGGAAHFWHGPVVGSAGLRLDGTGAEEGAGAWTGSAGLLLDGVGSEEGSGSWTGTAGLKLDGTGTEEGAGAWAGSAALKAGGTSDFLGVNLVTPPGGCGSLPSTMVLRSGVGASCSCLSSKTWNLTFSSITNNWKGTITACGGSENVTVSCSGGNWTLLVTGPAATSGSVTLSGTSGINPNLTTTATMTGVACTGSLDFTLTRT